MAQVSIPKGNPDPKYRYQRHLLVISSYGQGGNLKTKIENINVISDEKELGVPAEYILKFFGYELGTQTDIKNGDYIISGKHPFDKLEELLEKFIKKYVLCPSKECQKPEINILIKDNQIRCKCRACAHTDVLDSKHKLAPYIIRFPPKDKSKMTGTNTQQTSGTTSQQSLDIGFDPKKLKAAIKKLTEASEKNDEAEVKSIINEVNADPLINAADSKYFIFLQGIYSKDIYEVFENKVSWLKYALDTERHLSPEETSYHLLVSLMNLCLFRFAKEKDTITALERKIPSLLYLFYNEQIISEEFFIKMLRKKAFLYKNSFKDATIETVFSEKAEEFTKWLETANYENEDESVDKSEIKNKIEDL